MKSVCEATDRRRNQSRRVTYEESLMVDAAGRPELITAPAAPIPAKADKRKLGLFMLTGVVVGSMIGGGSFNLPANMSGHAGVGAVIIAWVITLLGMFVLANAFRTLADE